MSRLTGILKGVKVANNGERCPQIALVSPPIVLAQVTTHLNLHNQTLHLRGLSHHRNEQLASTWLAVTNRDRFSA